MNKLFFSSEELLQLGFELVHDGGESYHQFIADRDNYFKSESLVTEETPEGLIVLSDGVRLDETALFEYIKKSGGKEFFTVAELRKKGFTVSPSDNGFVMTYAFDTNDAFSKSLNTEEFQAADASVVQLRVINNVNAELTGFKYFSESQIGKLIERGGY